MMRLLVFEKRIKNNITLINSSVLKSPAFIIEGCEEIMNEKSGKVNAIIKVLRFEV